MALIIPCSSYQLHSPAFVVGIARGKTHAPAPIDYELCLYGVDRLAIYLF